MLPEVYGRSSGAMLRRLLVRKNVTEEQRKAILMRVEERGSTYVPEINAFYMCEFQMASAAEDVARFLHQACRALPKRLNDAGAQPDCEGEDGASTNALSGADAFHALVVENALAHFGSRVLHPSALAAKDAEVQMPTFAAYDKAAQCAARADTTKFETSGQEWGERLGNVLYDTYLAGKLSKSAIRKLFLAHLDEPDAGRDVCATIIAKTRRNCRG
jgi:hypothetical protein